MGIDEQLTGYGDENDFKWLAGGYDARDEGRRWLAGPFGAQSTHVEPGAHALCSDVANFPSRRTEAPELCLLGNRPTKAASALGVSSAMLGSSASKMVAETSPRLLMLR